DLLLQLGVAHVLEAHQAAEQRVHQVRRVLACVLRVGRLLAVGRVLRQRRNAERQQARQEQRAGAHHYFTSTTSLGSARSKALPGSGAFSATLSNRIVV